MGLERGKKEDKDKEGGRVKESMQGNKGCKEGRLKRQQKSEK